MYHGAIYGKKIKIGGFVYLKTVCFCVVHGEIDLFTCDNWDEKHGRCDRSEAAHITGPEIPKTKAA